MNPPPTLTFNIPSLHDQTELDCRLYIPSDVVPRQPYVCDRTGHRPSAAPDSRCEQLDCHDRSQHASLTRAAVLAHPYANLGGSFDDPAILAAVAELLRQGYIVATFNFRGAGRSKGSTSWTGLPELADYVSIVGFLLHFLNDIGDGSDPGAAAAAASAIDLAPGAANSNDNDSATDLMTKDAHAVLNARQAATRTDAAAVPQQAPLQLQRRISIVLGGYSYGSRILAHIPSISSIVNRFFSTTLVPGSSELVIRDAAIEIAAKQRACAQNVSSTILFSSPADAVGDVLSVRGEHSVQLGGSDELPARRKRTISSPKQIGNAIRRSVETVGNAAGGGQRRGSAAKPEDDAASPGPDGSGSSSAGNAAHAAAATIDSNNADSARSNPPSPSHSLHAAHSSSIADQLRHAIDLRFLHISPVLPPAGWLTSPRLDRPSPTMSASSSSGSSSSPAPVKMKVAGADMAITDSWADYPSLVLHGRDDQFTAVAKVQHWAEAAVAREKSFHEEAEVRVVLFGEEAAATAQDHFWHSRESTERLTKALSEWLSEVPRGRVLLD